ncbi:MAG: ribosome maturation factor RimP [Clostridia bacterium]|nr:ribosome maturation factor RimP [Clostridia bacterium]
MAYSKIEQQVLEMAKPVADDNGCYIYDVEYLKEGKSRTLRIFVDKEDGGISLDECEAISRRMSDLLDESDPVKENYMLEVSSPGIERRLSQDWHFEKYMGETIDIGLYKAINGSKQLSGKLISYSDGKITIESDNGELSIMQSETTGVKLHFDF